MLTSRLHDKRKHFAAAVMIAFLATLISMVGIQQAERRAVKAHGKACTFAEVDGQALPIELGKRPFLGELEHAFCLLDGMDRMLDADNFFLISYSAFNLTFFLFLAAIGKARPAVVWILAGLLLAVVMLVADCRENQILRDWIHAGSQPAHFPWPIQGLTAATTVKWGALAVASGLLGLLYLLQARRLAKLVAVPAFAAAAFLAAGLYRLFPPWVQKGAAALVILWLFILIHAVIVAITPRLP
ncbi:MAG TPA: hypothetical protein VFC23_07800, partial [Thermoanaerobaculia bacterium]|nr:hypothetical protein [Thermoanaerobaculia bacterium]